MDDLISRQEAIDALDCINGVEEVLRSIPPAEPKRIRGKWIDTRENTEWYAREYECSECGGTMLGESNFCPNCGAKMEEVTT